MSPAAPGRRSQEERRSEAERRLLAAAAELIGEAGPSKVTLAAIGERAGYSRGLATFHFGSKPTLMRRLVDTVTENYRDALREERRSDSAMDELLGFVRAHFRLVAGLSAMHRARLALWADAVATPSTDIRPAMLAADREFRDELAKGIERAVAIGEFPATVSPSGLATVIATMLRGVALSSMLDDTVDLDACRTEIELLLTARLQENP